MYVCQDIEEPIPCIVETHRGWSIYFDGVIFAPDSKPFSKAFEAWMAIFWVFSAKYPKRLENTCTFICKYLLEKKITVSGRVKRMAEKIMQ